MPKFFFPQRSDAHRIACAALYRALLKQCNELTSTTAAAGQPIPTTPLQNLIRYRFQRDRKLRSPNQIRHVLTQGRHYLNILHNVNSGSASALTELIQILRKTSEDAEATADSQQAQRERQIPQKPTAKAIHNQVARSKANHRPAPDSPGLAAHPLPLSALKSSSRVVPSFVSTQKEIPFLRYGKQPTYLSRVIRQKMNWRENAFSRIQMLELLQEHGQAEDDWDKKIHHQVAVELGKATAKKLLPDVTKSWSRAPTQALKEVYENVRAKEVQNAKLGERMWEILKQERCLKNWEDLPINISKAIKDIRKLEVRIHKFTQRHGTKYQFQLRPHNIPITDQVELKQIGRFNVPVEWAIRKEQKPAEYYKDLEASLIESPAEARARMADEYRRNGNSTRSSTNRRQNPFEPVPSRNADSESKVNTFTPFSQTAAGRQMWQQRFQRRDR